MFNLARIKLTVWYLLIITVISLAFSFFIYRLMTLELDRFVQSQQFRYERRFPGQVIPPSVFVDYELVTEVKNRIKMSLFVVNGSILLISGVSAYFLAGRTLKPIKDMVSAQNRFISDASHEFRTPLTSLKSSMEVFLRDPKPSLKEAKNLINDNIADVNKLQSLSDSLLNLAHFQNTLPTVKLIKTSLNQPIESAIKKISHQALARSIHISYSRSRAFVLGDVHSLTDLFVIFLDNAVKYSPDNSQITLTTKKNKSDIVVSISDQGIGIAPHDLPHIFDRFYRSDTARKNLKSGGYGLGLSIAKNILDSHHAQVEVKSKLGEGSQFIVKFPITKFS